jgi:DNA processing protein
MELEFPTRLETAALVALLRMGKLAPARYADRLEEAGTALAILDEEQGLLAAELVDRAAAEIAAWRRCGIRLLSVLDANYPQNLRAVYDRPPLLFMLGRLDSYDTRSIAVIGSRRASPAGLKRARAITRRLVDRGYTIVSGLAAGIDTAAHITALDGGGRTIGVIGTGLQHTYPPQNAGLQARIATTGAVISQFWPEAGPTRQNFPLRNAVMSGMALATIVVEATHRSGVRTQARAALAHGRPVLLVRELLDQRWARELAERPGVFVIGSLADLDELVARVSSSDALVA